MLIDRLLFLVQIWTEYRRQPRHWQRGLASSEGRTEDTNISTGMEAGELESVPDEFCADPVQIVRIQIFPYVKCTQTFYNRNFFAENRS
jgi:hypothetical protein